MPGGSVGGSHRVPGDKSISHRALLLSALVTGETCIENFLDGSDCRATAWALQALGIDISFDTPTCLRVTSRGVFCSPAAPLDLGNSGTGIRLLAGLLAGRDVEAVLTGDASLRTRPMLRVSEPLSRMGARIETSHGCAPLHVRPASKLSGLEFTMPVASAQVKSAVLLAGLSATETVAVTEPAVTRDHTERMLRAFGADVRREGMRVALRPGAALRSPGVVHVPGDLSSAAFLLAAVAMRPGARLTVCNVGVNPTRAGFLDLLARMGAKVSLAQLREVGGEPVADVAVEGARLCGIDIGPGDVALAIDEIPVLLALAAVAEGETVVRGAGELKVKESDRLAAMAAGLAALEILVQLEGDGIRVFGGKPQGGRIDSRGDHRIAMSFAILGQRAAAAVTIDGCETIDTSFPGFVALMQAAGLNLSETDE